MNKDKKKKIKDATVALFVAIVALFTLLAIKVINEQETQPPLIQEPTVNRAMAIVEPLVRSSMESNEVDYELSIQDRDSIILTINVPQPNAENATYEQWNELTESALSVSSEMYEILEDNNLNLINFGVFIGDVQRDCYFYAAINGSVMLDVPNGVGVKTDKETVKKGEVI